MTLTVESVGFEGGIGRSFYARVADTPLLRIISVGVVYYSQFKVTGDVASVLTLDRRQEVETLLSTTRIGER